MAIFGSGKRPPKGDSKSRGFGIKMAKYLDEKELRCVSFRDSDGIETVVAHSAVFEYDGELKIIAKDKCIFSCNPATMDSGELMSLEGVVITAVNLVDNTEKKVVAYYKYWRRLDR